MRFVRLISSLTVVTGLLWWLNRRWNAWFVTARVTTTAVATPEGTTRKGRTIHVQSILDAPPDVVWSTVKTPRLLKTITYPLLTFTPRKGTTLPQTWQAGATAELNLRGLDLLPLGPHDIHVLEIDEQRREIRTQESGAIAPVWNHFIAVAPYGDHQTRYTDTIDLYADFLTPAVATFAYFFYRYRQTRWQRLAPTL